MKGEETPLFFFPLIFIGMVKKKQIYVPSKIKDATKVSPWNRFYKSILGGKK